MKLKFRSIRNIVFLTTCAYLFSSWSFVFAATERQSPDAILTQTNLIGSVASIQDDPDSPDTSWLTAGTNVATTLRVSFPTPSGSLTTGAGVQEFKFWIRKTATNNGRTDDTYTVHLYENGVQVQSIIASGNGVSTPGTLVTATWDASNLSLVSGANVEAFITTTPEAGGNPGGRGSIEMGAVEWNVVYNEASSPTVTTDTETNVGNTGATMNGEITASGGSNATSRGFAWGTNSSLSGGDTSTTTESGDFGIGTFYQNVSNLVSNTTYYFRAYATNPTGTGYGDIDNFVTTEGDTPRRMMRLFEGFLLKVFEGSRFRIFQQ